MGLVASEKLVQARGRNRMTTRIVAAALGLLLLACSGSHDTQDDLPIVRLYLREDLSEFIIEARQER